MVNVDDDDDNEDVDYDETITTTDPDGSWDECTLPARARRYAHQACPSQTLVGLVRAPSACRARRVTYEMGVTSENVARAVRFEPNICHNAREGPVELSIRALSL